MKSSVEKVNSGSPIRLVATQFGIPKSTLQRNVKKLQRNKDARLVPNYANGRVFCDDFELTLANYLVMCSNMFYGLTPTDTRRLAYELAERNHLTMPPCWQTNKTAGKEWLFHFMTRHPQLSLRQPEATSLARASSFNRANISIFFDTLERHLLKPNISGFSIYNLDETGCTTVQKVPKVIAPRGQKQVGQITSQERGELVTIVGIVSATGSVVPPALIFPRKNFKEFMLTGASEGALGLATGNGWMKSEAFKKVMEHFIQHTRPTKDHPVILICDNHRSHLNGESLEMAKQNHIHLLTLPPHTSNKTQPLDRSVFGPFKTHFNVAANALMMTRPGKNVTIYDMAMLMSQAWLKAATPENITAGFRVSGIWPFNREIFTDIDFLPAEVTDRELPPQIQDFSTPPGTSNGFECNVNVPSTSNAVTPADLRGYPKAHPRTEKIGGQKRGKSIDATSTPELDRLRCAAAKKQAKERPVQQRKARKELDFDIDSDDDMEMNIDLASDSDVESLTCLSEPEEGQLSLGEVTSVSVGEFVLVEFNSKNSVYYYVGRVVSEKDEDGDIEIDFLRKSGKMQGKFVQPNVQEISSVSLIMIKLKLTRYCVGSTKRTQRMFAFKENLTELNVN